MHACSYIVLFERGLKGNSLLFVSSRCLLLCIFPDLGTIISTMFLKKKIRKPRFKRSWDERMIAHCTLSRCIGYHYVSIYRSLAASSTEWASGGGGGAPAEMSSIGPQLFSSICGHGFSSCCEVGRLLTAQIAQMFSKHDIPRPPGRPRGAPTPPCIGRSGALCSADGRCSCRPSR